MINPILWQKGVCSLLGVPLIADGRLLGVMHVGTLRPRQFDEHDTTVLQLAASRIASALWSQQTAAERSAARTLQQSLLPTRLPEVEGLEFASRFVPAEDFGVGGDWFDAFRLPDGGIGVVVGDVAGAGLRAAIVMGRLRSSLRAYAIESASPSEALDRVDRKFAHFEPDEMATILYVIVSPDLGHFTAASRGHPPPLIAVAGRDAIVVDCSPRPPIGAHVPAPPMDLTCELPVGSTVACYTDGLIERQDEPLDVGLERLRRAMHAGPPDEVCGSVMAQLIGSAPFTTTRRCWCSVASREQFASALGDASANSDRRVRVRGTSAHATACSVTSEAMTADTAPVAPPRLAAISFDDELRAVELMTAMTRLAHEHKLRIGRRRVRRQARRRSHDLRP